MWGVLASLAIDPVAPSRAALAERFWPDSQDPAQRLRNVLSLLRKEFAPPILTPDTQLVPGATCDVIELRQLTRRAQAQIEPRARRALLEEAALRINGVFLVECESDLPFDWIQQTRLVLLKESITILTQLRELQQEQGDEVAAGMTLHHLLSISPEYDWGDARSLHSRLPPLAITLDEKFQELPPRSQPALLALCVFPQSFTAEQARDIADVAPSDLTQFFQRGLLTSTANERFEMSALTRETLWRKLTGEQRRRLQERHENWFVQRTTLLYSTRLLIGDVPYLTLERANLDTVLDRVLSREPTWPGAMFLFRLWSSRSAIQRRLLVAEDYLNRILSESPPDLLDAMYVLMALLGIAQINQEYDEKSAYWAKKLDEFGERTEADVVQLVYHTLFVYHHHHSDDAAADFVRERLETLHKTRRLGELEPRMLYIIGENYLARKKPDVARAYCDMFHAYASAKGSLAELAAANIQQGGLQKALGRSLDARLAWNEALENFEALNDRHGVADCLQSLASLFREEGALSEARRAVLQAIDLYRECGDEAAVVAAGGTLGDILLDKGEVGKARELYKKGLAFWRERNHPRWTEKFENRLQSVHNRT